MPLFPFSMKHIRHIPLINRRYTDIFPVHILYVLQYNKNMPVLYAYKDCSLIPMSLDNSVQIPLLPALMQNGKWQSSGLPAVLLFFSAYF